MSKEVTKCVACLFLILYLTGCSKQDKVGLQEMDSYLKDEQNGLLKKEEQGGILAECLYRPSSLFIKQEIEEDTTGRDAAERKYNENLYFLLGFSREGKELLRMAGDQQVYSELVQTMSFRMAEYINLTTSEGDTVFLSDYAFQNTYGLSAANTLLLAFPRDQINKAKWMQINVGEFGLGLGRLQFRYRKEDVEKVPDLR